jgi:hypothetical protein
MKINKAKRQTRTSYDGTEQEYTYSSTISLISALDGGAWSKLRPVLFTPGGRDPLTVLQEAGSAPGPAWTDAENLAHHRDSFLEPSVP